MKDLDPAVERLILQCLEDDPKRRQAGAPHRDNGRTPDRAHVAEKIEHAPPLPVAAPDGEDRP